ncbi:hypothetical protein P389DRAFT_192847 [Cystobasidium minutum MCA 4210]|uniref:uncharacterized protein n=1 Tax=Cystobasidium minutum MCA 4210 TaxID=1397322 RepID=UPI0034CD8E14|eukprot:jgi/Rhomi1/192847/gm1.1061_g
MSTAASPTPLVVEEDTGTVEDAAPAQAVPAAVVDEEVLLTEEKEEDSRATPSAGMVVLDETTTTTAASTPTTTRRKSGSAPPEESSTARAARQVDMQHDENIIPPLPLPLSSLESEVAAVAGSETASTSMAPAATSKAASKAAAKNEKTERRRSTRTLAAKDKSATAAKASDSAAEGDEDEMALLPPTTTLLFTTSPPSKLTLFKAPSLPIKSLQSLIEVPEFRMLQEGELPMGRLRIQPNSGQQVDFSDEYYLKKHSSGENLERKGRKQERDRLIIERNRIKHQVEQLRLEVASASFYANASPIKGISSSSTYYPPSSSKNNGNGTASSSNTQNAGNTAATSTSRQSTPAPFSERMRESERNKRKQLAEAEETLRRYDELLQPREPYVTYSANGNNAAASNAPRTWLTGGKGIPPAPEGISPSDFLNAPRGSPLASLQQQVAQPQAAGGRASGSAVVAQRRLAQAGSGSVPSSIASPAQGGGASPGSSGSPAGGRVTRSRSSSPAVLAQPIAYSPIQPAQPVASTSSATNTPTRFVPILPRPLASGSQSQMPAGDTRATSVTSVTASGPSSLTLRIRQGSSAAPSSYNADTANASDGALVNRRRTRALQPIDVSLSRDDNYTSQYGSNGSLKRSAADAAGVGGTAGYPPGTATWQPLGTGQIRPRKRRKRRRRKGESSEEDDGAREAELEMEASMEFIDTQPDEYSYINNIKSSYAAALDHTQPLGTPDDPDDLYVDHGSAPPAASTSGRRASLPVTGRRNGQARTAIKDASSTKQIVPATATGTFRSSDMQSIFEDTTDYSDGLPAPPPVPLSALPSIRIDRASSASVSADEPARRPARAASSRASTPSGNTFKKQHLGRIPRQLFHRPDKPVEALLERSKLLAPIGRTASPMPAKSSNLSREASPRPLSTIEKAALTFESEGDLSSLPSETDDAGEASEFHDSESRFKSERALWRLETADTVAPAFVGSKGASHGAADLATSVMPDDVDEATAGDQLATMLDPNAPRKRARGTRGAGASSTQQAGAVESHVTVGGLKTRKRPHLDDYPVNDLNEITEADMFTLRESYQQVAARKKDMMGTKFLEMPVGDWQVYTPESDIRHT